ncbi:DUF2971 domain-containing protein [Undibacterium arcticum]|uniref:DUF2971 domain-containing protein n=1 Tax=Undibacterium arcticum TaxID=1762892 RepID=UPI00360B42EC
MTQNIYRYLSLNTEKHLEWFLGYLEGQAYFSSPLNFNDPFEMGATISPPSIEALMIAIPEVHGNYLSKNNQRKVAENVHSKFKSDPQKVVSEERMQNIGVMCLSEDKNNKLMWSHYADSHRGICIGFSTEYPPFPSKESDLQ